MKFKPTLLHATLAVLWILLLIPTLLWWKESILWVASMSLYANFVGHLSSYEAAKSAGLEDDERAQLDRVEEKLDKLLDN